VTVKRRSLGRWAATLSAGVFLTLSLAAGASAHGQDHRLHADLTDARAATARFHDVGQAVRGGYGQPPAPAPLHECITSFDGTGAMGFHFINGNLLDTDVDATKPEALVYAPDAHGDRHLVALEYVVFQAPWIKQHGSAMPMLFGEMFMATGEPNRFDIPAFFSLHVWLWQNNPAGLFEPFNPSVSCTPGHGRADTRGAGLAIDAGLARFDCAVPRTPGGGSVRAL
jgi:hypothetical protein